MCQPPERIRSAQAIRRHPSLGVSCNFRPGVPGPESTFGPAACSLAASGRSLSTGVLGPLPRQRVRTSRPGPSLSTRTGDVGRPITLVPVPPTPAGGTTTLIGSPPCRSGRRRIAGRLPTFAACAGTLSAAPRSVSTAVLTCGCRLLAQASAQFHVVNTRDIPWLLFVGWACHARHAEFDALNAGDWSKKATSRLQFTGHAPPIGSPAITLNHGYRLRLHLGLTVELRCRLTTFFGCGAQKSNIMNRSPLDNGGEASRV
jgi:hypothetical protein